MSCQAKCVDLEAKFKALDKDGNGTLSEAELKANLPALGISEAQLKDFLKAADKDKDGKISWAEFSKYYKNQPKK